MAYQFHDCGIIVNHEDLFLWGWLRAACRVLLFYLPHHLTTPPRYAPPRPQAQHPTIGSRTSYSVSYMLYAVYCFHPLAALWPVTAGNCRLYRPLYHTLKLET